MNVKIKLRTSSNLLWMDKYLKQETPVCLPVLTASITFTVYAFQGALQVSIARVVNKLFEEVPILRVRESAKRPHVVFRLYKLLYNESY